MEISWLGHSCLRIQSNEVTLITDPYDESLGLTMGRQSAEIVTISHQHPHHAHYAAIKGNPKVLQGPGEYEIANFYITGMGTDRNDDEGEAKINTVYLIQCEGLTICHLGDLNRVLSSRQIEELSQTDILFVPAGGVCTISTSRVAELAGLIDPKILVPLHYQTGTVKVEIQPLAPFLDDMGAGEPATHPRLSVTASNLPRDLRITVLEHVA